MSPVAISTARGGPYRWIKVGSESPSQALAVVMIVSDAAMARATEIVFILLSPDSRLLLPRMKPQSNCKVSASRRWELESLRCGHADDLHIYWHSDWSSLCWLLPGSGDVA